MNYFDFSGTLSRLDLLLSGAAVTVIISAVSMLLAMALAIACAILSRVDRFARAAILIYVEVIRNTPFIVQVFTIYFGWPSIGIRLDATSSAVIAMTIYGGAYLTEIIRAGIEGIPKGQVEAARALGMNGFTIFRKVILKPALASVYPSLCGQFILLLLSSSILSAISVAELTAAGNDIHSVTFRNFEAFLIVGAIYVILTTLFRTALFALERIFFPFKFHQR
jgi:polar amino acid transport system permease protein